MFFCLLCINLLPQDHSISKLEKLSMDAPVLINFQFNRKNISKSWQDFEFEHRENNSIYCASVYCYEGNLLCKRLSVKKSSTFLTIYRKFYQIHEFTNDSIQALNDIYKKSFTDPSSYCQNYYLPEDENITFNYPTYVLRFNDTSSCLELSKYKAMFPDFTFYIKKSVKTQPNSFINIDLCYSPSKCYENTHFYNPIDFIDEFQFDDFGNWTLNDVMSIKRRLVLIVYNDQVNSESELVKNTPKRSSFEGYIKSYSNFYLFGSLKFSTFSERVGQLQTVDDTPFMLITNTKKTRFMIVAYSRLNRNQISDKLNAARQGFLELHMAYYFDANYAKEHMYSPKNVAQFSIAAICVISFTAALIFWKAYYCINNVGGQNYKQAISI